MSVAARESLILEKLQAITRYAWDHSTFYRTKWEDAGVHPDHLRTLPDLHKFPVITKQQLREDQATNPPFGSYLCIPQDHVLRINGTSGTTGKPTAFAIGKDDWRRIANAHARIMWGMGLRPSDTVFIGSFFSLYIGSWGALVGAERIGCACFPFGAGVPGQTLAGLRWLLDIKPTAFYGTPSYALHLAEVARSESIEPRDFGFRVMFFSGEPGAGIPSTKSLIEETFAAHCIDSGSMAEMTPWMTNAECEFRHGMHLWQDIVYAEVCDPKTFNPVAYGQEGTPVYTHLERTSQPMIRLVSGDLTRWTNDACECGRTYPTLPFGIYGRIDDMFIVRGENIYPSAIEHILRGLNGFGGEYRIVISRDRAMDELVVQVEYDDTLAKRSSAEPGALATFQAEAERRLRAAIGVRPVVRPEAPGVLERTEFKARRVIDNRDLYRGMLDDARR